MKTRQTRISYRSPDITPEQVAGGRICQAQQEHIWPVGASEYDRLIPGEHACARCGLLAVVAPRFRLRRPFLFGTGTHARPRRA